MKLLFVPLISLSFYLFFSCNASTKDTEAKHNTKEKNNLKDSSATTQSLTDWILNLKKESQKYRDAGDPQKALIPLNTCIDEISRPARSSEEITQLGWAFVNRAYIHEQMLGNFLDAKHDYLSALDLFNQIDLHDFNVARFVLQPLGNIHTRLAENEQALIMLSKFKTASKDNNQIDALTNAFNDIGRVYLNKREPTKAIKSLQEGLNIPSGNHMNIGLLHSSLADAYSLDNQIDAGIEEAKKSEASFNRAVQTLDSSDYQFKLVQRYQIETDKIHGNLLVKKGKYSQALSRFEKALNGSKDVFPNKHREIGKIYLGLAKCHVGSNNFEAGVQAYQKSLTSIILNFNSFNATKNPEHGDLYADMIIGEGLIGKARTLYQLYQKRNNIDDLKSSLNTYLKYLDWKRIHREEQQNEYSKLSFASTIHQIGDEILTTISILQIHEPNKNWGEIGFAVIDQTKSILLEESRLKNFNHSQLAENDTSFHQLRQLKAQLSILCIEQSNALLSNDAKEKRRIDQQIEKLDEKYQLLHFSLKEKYPSYNKLRPDENDSLDIELLKQYLDKNQTALLSYFVGDSNIYISVIEGEHIFFTELDYLKYSEFIQPFIENTEDVNQTKASAYEKIAYSLYKTLISPIKPYISSNKLVLVPDGKLHQIPFEALVSSRSPKASFKNLNYVLYDYDICYSPLANFISSPNTSKKKLKPYLGIAPVFKNDQAYSWLSHSAEEVELGNRIFNGELLLSEKATKTRFLNNIEKFQIVHISTHAGKGTNTKNDGWMAFSTDASNNESRILTPELYQLDLSTELIVLNACETGRGELFSGEGTLSMTRGFLSAGAKNVMTNLWQVKHQSNLKILQNFLVQIKDTETVSEALNKSKIQFIKDEQTDELRAHPHYWAAPILIGTNNTISISNNSTQYIFWTVSIIVLLILTLLFVRKKSNR